MDEYVMGYVDALDKEAITIYLPGGVKIDPFDKSPPIPPQANYRPTTGKLKAGLIATGIGVGVAASFAIARIVANRRLQQQTVNK